MRVVGGIYRGRRLHTVARRAVRPTSDRLRETLFNILAPAIKGSRFLDVCAGSGAVGIEALSRGTAHATFIDQSRKACSVIKRNLESLGIGNEASIVNRDAVAALRRLAGESKEFDIAFVDPPYESEIYSEIMMLLATSGVLSDQAVVIVEHRAKTPPEPEFDGLRVYREVKQGESALAFYTHL